jgi:type VII secretion protein EccE
LALLVIVPSAMAYPWDTPTDWWVFGVAIAVVLLAFAWWGGLFLATMIGRRLAVWRRNQGKSGSRSSNEVTVLLHVEAPDGAALPLPVLDGYVDASESAPARSGRPAWTRAVPARRGCR